MHTCMGQETPDECAKKYGFYVNLPQAHLEEKPLMMVIRVDVRIQNQIIFCLPYLYCTNMHRHITYIHVIKQSDTHTLKDKRMFVGLLAKD